MRKIAGFAAAVMVGTLATLVALPISAKLSQEDRIAHALDRLTFGAKSGDLAHVRSLGLKKWIAQQLHPERIQENPVLEAKLKPLDTLTMSSRELVENYPPPQVIRAMAQGRIPFPSDPEKRKMMERLAERYKRRLDPNQQNPDARTLQEERRELFDQRRVNENATPEMRRRMRNLVNPPSVIAQDVTEAKIYRAVYSNRQLAEVLTDFWYNHFNVYLDKGADRYLVTSYERDAIRPRVLGKFKDMVLATAEHPAMLFYLDNWQSVDPEIDRGRKRRRGLNENYARELMELHTLGVDGGYTQKDVTEVARCFTGWTIRNPRGGGGFEFNALMHDKGEKTVLGVKIAAGGGKEDALKVIDILVHHPSTARYISRRLAQRFVADNPPPPLIEKMAKTFSKTDGDIRAVMKTMVDSKEFWAEPAWRAKLKSPFEMVVSAVRALDAQVDFAAGLGRQIAQLGQPLYRKQEPTGYPNTNEEWVNSAGLLGRLNFAMALTTNQIPGVKVDPEKFAGLRVMSPQTKTSVENAPPGQVAGLLIGSPDFQRR